MAARFMLLNGATIDNQGTFLLAAPSGILSGGIVTNGNVFRKTGSGTFRVDGFTNTPSGIVDVQAGTLGFDELGLTQAGQFAAAEGTNIEFVARQGQTTFVSDSTIDSAGSVSFWGPVIIAGDYAAASGTSVSGAASSADFVAVLNPDKTVDVGDMLAVDRCTANFHALEISASVVRLRSGTLLSGGLSVSQRFSWYHNYLDNTTTLGGSGTITILPGATMELGTGIKKLDGRSLEISSDATLLWSGFGDTETIDGGEIQSSQRSHDRQPGAFLLAAPSGILSGGDVTNSNVFRKTGSGTFRVDGFTNTPSGSVDVQAGTLGFDELGLTQAGQFAAAEGTNIEFVARQGQTTFVSDSTIDSAGSVSFWGLVIIAGDYAAASGTSVSGAASSADFVAVLNPDKTVDVGDMLAVDRCTANFHALEISASVVRLRSGTLLSGGLSVSQRFSWYHNYLDNTTTLGGSGTITILPGATMELGTGIKKLDGRSLEISSDATLLWSGFGDTETIHGGEIQLLHGATIDNHGAFLLAAPSGILSGGEVTNSNVFRKTGSGEIWIDDSLSNLGLTDVQDGLLHFRGNYTQSAGETRLSGGSISSSSPLDIQGGMLTGSGVIDGGVTNGGTVSPGLSPGLIEVSSGYTQTAGGKLKIEIGGLEADRASISSRCMAS